VIILRLIYLIIGLALTAGLYAAGMWIMQQPDADIIQRLGMALSLWGFSTAIGTSMAFVMPSSNELGKLAYICFAVSSIRLLIASRNPKWIYEGPALVLLVTVTLVTGLGWQEAERPGGNDTLEFTKSCEGEALAASGATPQTGEASLQSGRNRSLRNQT
jgi:hypothetical protein